MERSRIAGILNSASFVGPVEMLSLDNGLVMNV
jgi:hypothetical protein